MAAGQSTPPACRQERRLPSVRNPLLDSTWPSDGTAMLRTVPKGSASPFDRFDNLCYSLYTGREARTSSPVYRTPVLSLVLSEAREQARDRYTEKGWS